MTIDSMLELARKLVDVLLVWGMLYYVLKSLRKNVKMILLFKGILVILIVKIISDWLDLVTIGYLIDYIVEWAPLALIVIFQPEIRDALEQLGRTKILGSKKTLSSSERERTINEIALAIDSLRRQKMGALIVLERETSLADYIANSQKIYAEVTNPLLTAIFFVNNPLHDGGVIIQGDQIACANTVFPTSDNINLSKRLGTRHRAALGISEQTDCIAIILSEETGRISIAIGGKLLYNISLDELKIRLIEGLAPTKKLLVDDEEVSTREED
ncbi:MAG: TIGR00159 family protein [Bacilli bacterium]|nr:TIGR00159 family protein [Bacilli bacterium]